MNEPMSAREFRYIALLSTEVSFVGSSNGSQRLGERGARSPAFAGVDGIEGREYPANYCVVSMSETAHLTWEIFVL